LLCFFLNFHKQYQLKNRMTTQTKTQIEIVNAIQDIHYMDAENISNIIVGYDDPYNEFIKTKDNSYIRLLFTDGDEENSSRDTTEEYHIDNPNQIFRQLNGNNEIAKIEKLREDRCYKMTHRYGVNHYELEDNTFEEILDHIYRCYESNINNCYFNIHLEFNYKKSRPITRDFNYNDYDDNEEGRLVDFVSFIKMCKTNVPKWIKLL